MEDELTPHEPEPLPRDKSELLERVERARAALERNISGMSDARLAAPGPDEGWSVKDHLAHLAAWEAGIAALLQGQHRYAAMGVDRETYLSAGENDLNAIIHRQNKDRSAADVLAAFRQAQRGLLGALAGLSDADLLETYSHYQPDEPGEDSGEPILKWIAGNTYEHYDEHHGWIRRGLSLEDEARGPGDGGDR